MRGWSSAAYISPHAHRVSHCSTRVAIMGTTMMRHWRWMPPEEPTAEGQPSAAPAAKPDEKQVEIEERERRLVRVRFEEERKLKRQRMEKGSVQTANTNVERDDISREGRSGVI